MPKSDTLFDTVGVNVPRAAGAGLLAGSAYLTAMVADNKLSSQQFDDLKLVGQFFTTKWPAWQAQGLLGHFSFSVVMGLLYAVVFYRRLPGPAWLRGLIFINLENALLYPLAAMLDRVHAGMKSGQVPSLFERKVFQGQLTRHFAFGLVLGLLYRPQR